MASENDDDEKRKLTEVKYILVAGFACGIVAALIIMGITGALLYAARTNPIALLAGAFGLGIGGLFLGSFCGLGLKLVLEFVDRAKPLKHVKRDSEVTFWLPIIVSGGLSLVLGVVFSIAVIQAIVRWP